MKALETVLKILKLQIVCRPENNFFLIFFIIIQKTTRVYLSHVFIKYFSSMFGQVKWKIEFRLFFLTVCSLCLSSGNSHAY